MSLTAEEIRNCTMIALNQPPPSFEKPEPEGIFKFTVNVAGTSTNPLRFEFYNSYKFFTLFTGTILWGDGEESECIRQNIGHTYIRAGTYQITMDGHFEYYTGSNITHAFVEYTEQLISIDTPLPQPERYNVSNEAFEPIIIFGYSFNSLCLNCVNLNTIHENLFKYSSTTIENLIGVFNGSGITTIPDTLFLNCHRLLRVTECFLGCSSLTYIPNDLFKDCTNIVSFNKCFYNCSNLLSIPSGLFDNCTLVTTFEYCFCGCRSITSIPDNLFDNCTLVTTFESCFANCRSITSIPNNLFDNCTLVTTFESCFIGCYLLSIPSGLFDNCTLVTTFESCFNSCSFLTSIPNNLFDNCTLVVSFALCFSSCNRLLSIPDNLFYYNTLVKSFESTFAYCRALQSIPYNLFENCSSVVSFNTCFYSDSAIVSAVPELWNSHSSTRHGWCFRYCTNALNYSDIPSDWK